MKKLLKILSFIFVISSLFSAVAFTPNTKLNEESKVCAAGSACILNTGDCESRGLSNFLGLLGGSIIYVNFNTTNRATLSEKINSRYGSNPVLCINSNIQYIIKYVESTGVGSQNPIADADSSMVLYADGVKSETPRVCGIGTTGLRLDDYAGCCPGGTKLVRTAIVGAGGGVPQLQDNRTLYSYVACCPSGYNYYGNTGEYNNKCVHVVEGNSVVLSEDGLQYNNSLKGLSLAQSTTQDSNNVLVEGQRRGATYTCSDRSDCAFLSYNAGFRPAGCHTVDDSGKCVGDSKWLEENSTLSCQGCFSNGQAIGIVTAESNPNKGKVAICRTGGTVEYVEGVNGSLSDTEACLRSEGGYSGENYQLCKSCRESGGTWSGLGCVDSTPTGIITWIIRIAYGVMGGVALIQFIIAGIYYQTGQEEKVREARKNIIATITGLAVLTFSILILRIIGINILDILPTGSI